jgi:HAE1 family hydrophobic/amphiphilic exporter-1
LGLTRLAIRRPVTMIMIIVGLLIMGAISYTRLPVQQLPNVSFPFVIVSVNMPGATPEDMLQQVTLPIENAVSGVSGVTQMSGTSSDGSSRVALQFAVGTDVNTAANDVAQVVNRIQGQLPSGASTPTIIKADPNASPIMNLAVSGNLRPEQLYALASNILQPALQQVPGVAAVSVQGGLVPQVNVTVNPSALAAYGVSLQQVDQAIAAQNVSVPGGNTTVAGQTSTMRTNAYFQSVDQLRNLVVATRPQGNVLLGQIADVQQGYAPPTQETLLDGRTAVGLSVTAQSGANVVAVDAAVKRAIARLGAVLPEGVRMAIVNDQTVYTYASMRAVEDDLILAVILPAIVLLLFLHRPRNMFIVLLAIPTSLVSTFTLMYFFGFSLDLVSLIALSLITGILVDDSIVVLENINRHLAMRKSPEQAAIDGRSEIGQAAIAITLTDVVVYAPIAFTSGLVGQFFREFGLTIVVATLFSLFVSFTLTPLLAARWLKEPLDEEALARAGGAVGPWDRFSAAWERGYGHLRDWYGRAVDGALRHRGLVIFGGVLALLVSIAFIPLGWVGTAFTPQEDNSQFSVNVQLPVGTALAPTEAVVNRLDQEIRAMPGVKDTYLTAGSRGGFFGGASTNTGQISVDLLPVGQRPPIDVYLAKVRALGRQFPGTTIVPIVSSALRVGGGQNIGVVLQGPDIDTLNQLASRLVSAMQTLPGVVGVRSLAAQQTPELEVTVNRDAAAYFGITAQQIGAAVQTAVAGTTASNLRPAGSTTQTPIVVSVAGGSTMTPQQLEDLPLAVGNGAVIRLGQVATVTRTNAPAQINDQNRQLQVSVDAATQGIPTGKATQEVTELMGRLGLPPGYSWSLGGESQQQQQVFGPLTQAFGLSVVLVYMLTSALYESLLYPLAILFSLPLATVGAFSALAVSGNTLNLYSFMGLIMLMGLVAKNAILLVDFTQILRERGLTRIEAIVEAGRARLRPILMTTATMVFAMLPLALKIGSGSEERSPMATVLIGGLVTSTLLTLFFVPCMYTYLDDFGGFLQRMGLMRRPSGRRPGELVASND